MNIKQLKKYIFFSILSIGLMALIYMGIKNIPTSQREIDRQDRELQKLKESLFDCDKETQESTCTSEEVDKIQEKIRELESPQ